MAPFVGTLKWTDRHKRSVFGIAWTDEGNSAITYSLDKQVNPLHSNRVAFTEDTVDNQVECKKEGLFSTSDITRELSIQH